MDARAIETIGVVDSLAVALLDVTLTIHTGNSDGTGSGIIRVVVVYQSAE